MSDPPSSSRRAQRVLRIAGTSTGVETERASSERSSESSGRDSAPMSTIRPRARLLDTPYCSLEWDSARAIVRFTRSELPYASIADIEEDGIAIQRALERAGKLRLLVDLRPVVPRNDPGFELAISTFRRRVVGGRERVAILVRTAVGALQVKRHVREDGSCAEVFTSEEEALSYLETRSSERSPASPRARSWA